MSRNCSYVHEREVRGHLDHLGYLRTYHCTQLAGKSMRQGMFRPSTVCVAAANVCTTPVNTCFVPRFHDRRDHGLVSDVRTLIGSVNGGRIPGAPCRPPVPRTVRQNSLARRHRFRRHSISCFLFLLSIATLKPLVSIRVNSSCRKGPAHSLKFTYGAKPLCKSCHKAVGIPVLYNLAPLEKIALKAVPNSQNRREEK